MEPEAVKMSRDNIDHVERTAIISIAISMRRIADTVAGDSTHLDLVNGVMSAIESGIRSSKT